MNVEKRANIIKDWIENYCKNESSQPKTLVIGISGGIDSSVVSTLCALTGRKTIVLSMPIKQIKSQHDLSIEHGKWLTSKFKNVVHKIIELENILFGSEMVGAVRGIDPKNGQYFDDTRLYIDKLGLTQTQQEQIFSGNARRVYPKLDQKLKARGL